MANPQVKPKPKPKTTGMKPTVLDKAKDKLATMAAKVKKKK